MLADSRVFSSMISLVTAVDSILNTAPHFDSPHVHFTTKHYCVYHYWQEFLVCMVRHFSSISVTQLKTWKTAKVPELHALCAYLFLQVTCLPNCPDYNFNCMTLCITIMLAIIKCMISKINPYTGLQKTS